ncbi:YARHG domain-containing protein [Extibacter muris]|uniref:YARHG domain-containing protein n=1 Tax=Extibacter muris TaxID=1796622 RepID=UPI001D05E8E0|nr:YARHG domain-containing protein [Extibacter muris]MCB6201072.1 YARHG domain-containing protein [Extibacter muris]MCQ4662402.1 YARHG domain-containing protein [Extibacter muris]MCQ4691671.1 YARHG domain-containing protein [Extibacter muris]
MKKYCEQCGCELNEEDIYCSNCGEKCELPQTPIKSTDNDMDKQSKQILSDIDENKEKDLLINKSRTNKKLRFTLIIAGVLIILCLALYLFYSTKGKVSTNTNSKSTQKLIEKSQLSDGMVYCMTIDEYFSAFNNMAFDEETQSYDRNIPPMEIGNSVEVSEKEGGVKYDAYHYRNEYGWRQEPPQPGDYMLGIELMVEPDTQKIIGLSATFPKNDDALATKVINILCPNFKKANYDTLYTTLNKIGYAFMYKKGTVFEVTHSESLDNCVILRMTATTKDNYKEQWENNPDLPTLEKVQEMENSGYSNFTGTWEGDANAEGKGQLIISDIDKSSVTFTLHFITEYPDDNEAFIQNVTIPIKDRIAEFEYDDDNFGGFGKGRLQFEINNEITVKVEGPASQLHLATSRYKKISENTECQQITGADSNVDKSSQAANSEYIFFDSDSRYLTESEVMSLDPSFLAYARNEIFARHGRIFDDPEIRSYFESKSWYNGTISGAEFDSTVMNNLNDYEKANIEVIKNVEILQKDFEGQRNWNNG